MPRIPTYEQPVVQEQALPGVRQTGAPAGAFQTPDYVGAAAAGLNHFGGELSKHAEELQAKEDTATSTQTGAKAVIDLTDYKLAARKRLGDQVKGLPEEADKFFEDTARKYIQAAPNEKVKQYLTVFFANQQADFHGYIGAHAAEQLDKAQDLGFEAHISAIKNAAAVDPATAEKSAKEITAATILQLNKKGITDPEVVQQAILEQSTSLHKGVVNTLMVNDPKRAAAYYGMYKDDINAKDRNEIEKVLKTTTDAVVAIESADSIWKSLGPKGDGQPVQLDVMENEVRKMFAGDADKIKETIGELRSRASSFNSGELERSATNTNKVLSAFANGTSLAALKRMPEFASLSGEKQLEIQTHVENKLARDESRAAARESRAAARESREYTANARAEKELQKKNFSAYLLYSNPQTLSTFSENRLIAMIPQLGEAQVESLVKARRALDSPSKVIAAQVDHDDFNQAAQAMGLNPFKAKQTEEEKATLGALSFRVKNLIDQEQDRLNRQLSRPEKQLIMRQEAARTVRVKGDGWFDGEENVPVITLKADQVSKVVIPPEERSLALARLEKMRKAYPQDPNYAPTEENLRKMYLQSKSITANDIE